jgi:TolA-binding protein
VSLEREERECRGELVARERRGGLSTSDQIALNAHLETCDTCRLTRDIRADFDAQSIVELGDAARIAQLSASARRWSQRRARPAARAHLLRRRLRALGLSLFALSIAGTASATVWWWRAPDRLPLPVEAKVRAVPVAPRAAPRAPSHHASASDPIIAPPPVVESPIRPKTPRRAERGRAPLLAMRAPEEPADSLLRRAGEARHRGEIDLALALYRRLQREFRDSPEATLSSVLVGGIFLQRGLAQPALEQFDRYLASQPRGNLVPEALYGRGRALASGGQGPDEKQTWRRLLAEFPESAYAPHARRRLAELK